MMSRLLLSLAFATVTMSCSTTVPDGEVIPAWDGKAVQVCEAEYCPPAKNTGAALMLIDRAMFEVFGESHEVIRRIKVVYHEAGTCHNGCTGEGDTFNPSKVHVYEGDETVAGSALVHEVLHVIGNKFFGDEDPDHLIVGLWRDPELPYAYSIEDEVQFKIIEAGL